MIRSKTHLFCRDIMIDSRYALSNWRPIKRVVSRFFTISLHFVLVGVVWWCEGVMYLVSPGRPTDIGLQLGKAYYR